MNDCIMTVPGLDPLKSLKIIPVNFTLLKHPSRTPRYHHQTPCPNTFNAYQWLAVWGFFIMKQQKTHIQKCLKARETPHVVEKRTRIKCSGGWLWPRKEIIFRSVGISHCIVLPRGRGSVCGQVNTKPKLLYMVQFE